MVSESLFKRPDGIRDGIGSKPLAVRSRTLSGANPSIKLAGAATTIRIIATSSASGNCALQQGLYDGQLVTLVMVSNGGTQILPSATTSQTHFPNGDWLMDEGSTLTVLWDERAGFWREYSRSDTMASTVTLYDESGNPVDVTESNGINELNVSDADVSQSLSEMLKVMHKQTELLEKLLKKGK